LIAIELYIRVMNAMQTPQCRHGVKYHVLEVDRQIEQHQRKEHGEPSRQGQIVEQSPTVSLAGDGHGDRRPRHQ
jgi:hypothetical protein